MLKSIASQGIVPLFTHWANTNPMAPGNSVDPGEWANTAHLVEYTKSVAKTTRLEAIEFQAVDCVEQSYTWPWKTLLNIRKELDSLTGLAHISLDGHDGDDLLVEFTGEKVTVATILGTPEISCREMSREEWTDQLLELITGREPETYGKVFGLRKESVDKMKQPVWLSIITIYLLK